MKVMLKNVSIAQVGKLVLVVLIVACGVKIIVDVITKGSNMM